MPLFKGYLGIGRLILLLVRLIKGVIVTLDECISKLRLAYPLNSKHKDGVSAAISTLLRPGLINAPLPIDEHQYPSFQKTPDKVF
jgi:hypothetical protein